MMKRTLLALALATPLLATDMPPAIPDAPIQYSDITYETNVSDSDPYASVSSISAPMMAASSERRGYVNVNALSTDYTVRGMGVKDSYSKYGYSSVSASYTLPNRNLFGRGLQHRISGEYGIVWDASCALGETPLARVNYAMGKEIFPNLMVEVGYSFRHGGLEGLMARYYDGASHRAAQELNAVISYNDHQRGFFGKFEMGLGFYGLTGLYFDLEGGYRFTDVLIRGNMGADLELSAGVAPSVGYWGSDVEGVDAWRIKAALLPYSQSGTFGRDSRFYVKPWLQCSWSGSNAAKIDRVTHGAGPVDHFLITLGVDCGFIF